MRPADWQGPASPQLLEGDWVAHLRLLLSSRVPNEDYSAGFWRGNSRWLVIEHMALLTFATTPVAAPSSSAKAKHLAFGSEVAVVVGHLALMLLAAPIASSTKLATSFQRPPS